MKVKKILSLSLALCMLLLAACGTPAASQPSPSSQAASAAEPSSSAAVETPQEPIEISYLINLDLALQESYTTEKMSELLKNYGYNVKFNIKSLGTHDPKEWLEKFQLSVASGEAPCDIMQLGDIILSAVDAGWFAEIDLARVQENMPKYYDQVIRIYDKLWAKGKDPRTGAQYGLPSFNMYGPNRHTLAYRQDWLEKFDMQAPTNLEEFEEWLRKCRTEDPNGNGQNDEFGYTSQDEASFPGFSEIFGAYGIMPGQWQVKGDVVSYDAVDPVVKDALTLLRKWYSDDLLPKGILTTAKRDNDFYSGMVGTMGQAGGYSPAIVPTGSYYAALVAQQPTGTIIGAPSPKGPNGDFGTWEWGPMKYILQFGKHMEKEPEKMDMIMKMFETIATEKELFEMAMFGERGTHWEFVDKAANKGSTIFLEPYTDFTKKLNEVGVRELSESAFCPVWVDEVYQNYMDPLAIEYASQNPGRFDPLLRLPLPSSAQYADNLMILTKSTYYDIITGKKPIDYFDEYVAKWKAEGGDQLTQEANELYQKLFK